MTISAHSQYRHCQYHIVVATSLWSSQTPWLPWLSWLPWWPPSSSSSSSSSSAAAAAAAAASTPSTQASTTSTSAFQCHPNHWHRLLLVFVEAAPCQLHPVSLQGLRAATLRGHVIQVSFKSGSASRTWACIYTLLHMHIAIVSATIQRATSTTL